MGDPNAMAVIRLNQIILGAQHAIQNGQPMREIWNMLYVPPELLNPVPPLREKE